MTVSAAGMLLPSSLHLYRATDQPDGMGGTTPSWSLVAEDLPMRLCQATARERLSAQQAGAEFTHRIYCAPAADVRRGDEWRTTDGDLLHVYRVVDVVEPSTPGVYRRADCLYVQRKGTAL